MDTQAMVAQLMRAESMRMNRLTSRRQVLQWRQESVRSTMTFFNDFRSENTRPNNAGTITNPGNPAWQTVKTNVTNPSGPNSGGGINVTASNSARIGQTTVEVVQTAQTAMARGSMQFRGTAVGTTAPSAELDRSLVALGLSDSNEAAGTITINGVNISINGNDTTNDIMQRVNQSDAGVTMSFDNLRGLFTITQKQSGEAAQIKTSGTDLGAAVLNRMGLNGIDTESATLSISTQGRNNPTLLPRTLNWNNFLNAFGDLDPDKNFLRINNSVIMLNDPANPINDMHDLMARINADVPEVTVGYDAGSFTITGATNVTIFSTEAIDWDEDFNDIFGTMGNPSCFIRINDVTISFFDAANPANDILNMNDLMARINADVPGVTMEFDAVAGRYTLTGDETRIATSGSGFGATLLNTIGLNNVNMVVPTVRTGRDAIIYFEGTSATDGVRIQQASNVFELEGLTIDIANATGRTYDETNNAPIREVFNISTTRDVDAAVDEIKKFVESYNNLIRHLNSIHSTPRPRAGNSRRGAFFEPLTDEQRQAMSEREIERWEEQAKIGLLHRDRDIRNIHQQLRDMMMQRVQLNDGTTISLSQIGISTIGMNGAEGDRLIGVLAIDEDQLRAALESEPDRVRQLFARSHVEAERPLGNNASERNANIPHVGLGFRIDEFFHTLTQDLDSPLRRRAGSADGRGLDASENMMTRQIRDYNRRIDEMQAWLQRRENHFYAMFAKMEQAMAQSHAQMDSLFAFMQQ
jgi:flagellar capping protein FliD